MLADLRIDHFDEMRLNALVRTFLIVAHQARIPHHIDDEDRGETAAGGRGGHCSGGANPRAEFNLLRARARQFYTRAGYPPGNRAHWPGTPLVSNYRGPTAAPHDAYRTHPGEYNDWCVIVCHSDEEWQRLV
jgi:hypothetical protein